MTTIKKVGWGFGRCNQFCEHCYNASKPKAPEYTFAELKAVADKICPFITDINYGTGEFVINPNTPDLAEYVADTYPHVAQAVTSNGYSIVALRPEKVKRLFHDVDVSLDFPDATRHNAFRRHKSAWAWVQEALAILQEQGVPRSVVTCVTSKTTDDDIIGLLEIARRFGATWRINWFRHTGRGTGDLRLTAARAWEVLRLVAERAVFQCIDPIFGGVLGVPCSPCPAGWQSARIHENMETSCYPFLKGEQWSGGNVMHSDVSLEGIFESAAFVRLRERHVDFCHERHCEYHDVCRGGCVTRGFLHSGGLNEPDDYCLFVAGLDVEDLRTIPARYEEGEGLVHNGYLCTTIVRPL